MYYVRGSDKDREFNRLQQAGAAGVVQMHVGEHQPVQLLRRAAGGRERAQHGRYGQVVAVVDEGGEVAKHRLTRKPN